jgi:putative tryptophan/tyrosine transport system substrate-binding protein
MRRRDFIAIIGNAAIGWPLGARAQQPVKLRTIGFMGSGTASSQSEWTAAFLQRLHELGWSEGRNIAIEYRWAEGRSERLAEIAAEFVRLKADLILTHNTPPTLAAKRATSAIPIVFATAGDPVGTGIVASLARPGGNITGLSSEGPDTASKRLGLLRELVPGLQRLAILADTGNAYAALEERKIGDAARTLGVEVATFEMGRAADIDPAFDTMKGHAQALYVLPVALAFVNRVRINTLALAARLPTLYLVREYVDAGGLMSYGPNWPDMWRRAADFVDKILRGAKPGDLPVQAPTKFELVINLKTAKGLGLTVPPSLLASADEVIE